MATVIDAIHARLREDPAMHVYHYGHAEVSVLKRLCMLHAIREEELDHLLRRHIFVDLHQAVRQAMRIGLESYGLKKVETLPGFVRTADVGRGADAVLEYEYYLASRDEQHLRAIESYNDEDCRSTVAVFDWLRAPGARPTSTWLAPADGARAEEEPHEPSERELLREELVADEPEGSERWLAGELLAYHSRAAKQQWWAYFQRKEMSREQLLADGEVLAGLELLTDRDPIAVDRSLAHPMRYPPQDHKISRGDNYEDPESGKAVSVHAIDEDERIAWVKRGVNSTNGLPAAVMSDGPIAMPQHQAALMRVALSVRDRTGRVSRSGAPPAQRSAGLLGPGSRRRRPDDGHADAARARARPRQEHARHPGAAGHRQDLHRRAPDHRPRARGQARRSDGAEPQGDRQPLQRDRSRRRRRGVHVRRHEARQGPPRRCADQARRGQSLPGQQGHRRNLVAVRPRGHGCHARLPRDRRGGPVRARRRARLRHLRAQPDPARRSQPAQPGGAGRASARLGRECARARPRRRADDPRGARDLPGRLVPHAPGDLLVHLERVLRRAPALAPMLCRALDERRHRPQAARPSSTSATCRPRRRKRLRSGSRSRLSWARPSPGRVASAPSSPATSSS